MPKDKKTKLVFVAGGIGITPFRSMVKYLLDTNEERTITLLYSIKKKSDIAYGPVFEEAHKKIGLKIVYLVTDESPAEDEQHVVHGRLTTGTIKKLVPDFEDRLFYVSGTHQMVHDVRNMLIDMDVHQSQVKIDFFPGYS